jgi:DNA-binding response OmpR family regulator
MVTADRKRLAEFAEALIANEEIQLAWAATGTEAIADVTRQAPLGAVIDETLPDMSGLELVRRLLRINALINTAVVSRLDTDDFHEASEGLGILAQLPSVPSAEDANALFARLKRLVLISAQMPA